MTEVQPASEMWGFKLKDEGKFPIICMFNLSRVSAKDRVPVYQYFQVSESIFMLLRNYIIY
jgi:hypothetical protein